MKIAKHVVVEIDYVVKDIQGNLLDSSEEFGSLTYVQGVGGMVPGLEVALAGKTTGDTLDIVIPAKDAYGVRSADLEQIIPMDTFEDKSLVVLESEFELHEDGEVKIALITEIDGDDVHIDLNHPFADLDIHYDVKVLQVREATKEEIESGHVHGAGCDH